MSDIVQSPFGREIGRRLLKGGIAVVGLLLVRLVLGWLPMVAHADPIVIGSLFGIGQAVVSPAELAKTIIDTFVFVVLLVTAVDTSALMRSSFRRLPDIGRMTLLAAVVVVVALAYSSYSNVVLPIIGNDSVYDWTFLVLGVLPLAGLAVLVYRNLDTITDIVFHSSGRAMDAVVTSRSSALVACSNCGQPLAPGARFCTDCGTAVKAIVTKPIPDVFCSICGSKNIGGAVSCVSCGKAIARAVT